MELNRESELNKKDQTSTLKTGNPEAEIRQICDEIIAAMQARDVDKIMSFYAPDVVAFDVTPPAQFVGKEAYRKTWVEAFEMCEDNSQNLSDLHNLEITADENLAFVHAIRHDMMTPTGGKKTEMWMRVTQCFEKLNGKWLITHEQFSFPVDMESGKAIMNAKPEGVSHLH